MLTARRLLLGTAICLFVLSLASAPAKHSAPITSAFSPSVADPQQRVSLLRSAWRLPVPVTSTPVFDPLGYYHYRWSVPGASTADADDVPAVAPEPTDQCGVMVHTDLDGTASFSWGYGPQGLKAQTAGECCEKCRQHHKCNTFSWCGQPLCFAPDIWCAKRQGSRQWPAIPPSDEIGSFCFGRAHPAACPVPPAQEPLVWRVLAQAVSGSDGTPGQHERRLHGQVPETASDGAAPSGVDRGRAQVEEPGGQRHVEQPRGLVSDGTSTHYTPIALSRY